MHNLEDNLKDITMDNISKFVSLERDVAYMIAQEKEQTKFVSYLLSETNHSIEQIAAIAGVSAGFVKSVQQKLSQNK